MDGAAIIRALLVGDAALLALVPEERIVADDLGIGIVLPAIAITSVSWVERKVLKPGVSRHVTERVQVDVMAKRVPEKKAVLRAVRAAAADFIGAAAGLTDVSVQLDSAGPDITDDQASIRIGSQDFMVGFTEIR